MQHLHRRASHPPPSSNNRIKTHLSTLEAKRDRGRKCLFCLFWNRELGRRCCRYLGSGRGGWLRAANPAILLRASFLAATARRAHLSLPSDRSSRLLWCPTSPHCRPRLCRMPGRGPSRRGHPLARAMPRRSVVRLSVGTCAAQGHSGLMHSSARPHAPPPARGTHTHRPSQNIQ